MDPLFDAQTLDQRGKRILVSSAGMKGLYAFARIDARHVPVTHTRAYTDTFANCTYAHIHMHRQTCASVHVPVNTTMRRTVLYGPRRRGNGTQMLELFTLNLRDDVREANARGKMQNAECKIRTVWWTRPEKARWKLGLPGEEGASRRSAVRSQYDRLKSE